MNNLLNLMDGKMNEKDMMLEGVYRLGISHVERDNKAFFENFVKTGEWQTDKTPEGFDVIALLIMDLKWQLQKEKENAARLFDVINALKPGEGHHLMASINDNKENCSKEPENG